MSNRPPWDAQEYMWAGLGIAIIGAIAVGATASEHPDLSVVLLYLLSALSGLLLLVAVVGKGVEIGLRAVRERDMQRPSDQEV